MFSKILGQAKKDAKKNDALEKELMELRPTYEAEAKENLPKAQEILERAQKELGEIGFHLQPAIEVNPTMPSIARAQLFIQPYPIGKWYEDRKKKLGGIILPSRAGAIGAHPLARKPQEGSGEAEKPETKKDPSEGVNAQEAASQGAQEGKD